MPGKPTVKLCECGCGLPAPIAKYSDRRWGHIKGEPVRFAVGHNGRVASPETRAKISAANAGKPKSSEHRGKIRAAATGRILSPATRAKIGAASQDRTHSDEARLRISQAATGRTHSAEAKKKISAANLGKHVTTATRRRLSIAKGGTGNPTPSSIHKTLNRHHPKSGVCEQCGAEGKTDYAFKRHPEPHTIDRADYRELCTPCHRALDQALGVRRIARRSRAGS